MSLTRRFKAMNCVAWALCASSMAIIVTWDSDTSRLTQVFCQILYGIGGGILYPGRLYAVQSSLMDGDIAIGTTMVTFMTSFGECFGICIGGAILQNSWAWYVNTKIADGLIPENKIILPQEIESARALLDTFPSYLQEIYQLIMSKSLAKIWTAMVVVSILGLVACLLGKNSSLYQAPETGNATTSAPLRRRSIDLGLYSRLEDDI